MQSPEEKLKSFSAEEPVSDRYSFTVDVTDPRGKRWYGHFVAKAPTLGEMVDIGRLKASYLPEGAVDDPSAAMINEMICRLAYCLVEKPTWWNPVQFTDVAPLSAVYEEVTAFHRRFRGEKDPKQNRSASEDQDRSGDTVAGQADLGRKVRPAAERSETIVSNRE